MGECHRPIILSCPTNINLFELRTNREFEAKIPFQKLNMVSREGGTAATEGEESNGELIGVRESKSELGGGLQLLIYYWSIDSLYY